uniref:Putative secreted protein n=1 Tax=Anopheles darlingi TaxID=43151 RepID=A0A2M4DI71_ANODA
MCVTKGMILYPLHYIRVFVVGVVRSLEVLIYMIYDFFIYTLRNQQSQLKTHIPNEHPLRHLFAFAGKKRPPSNPIPAGESLVVIGAQS